MEDYSKKRNKHSTQAGYQAVINRNIIPLLGRKKVQDVKRPDIAGLMEKLSYKQDDTGKDLIISQPYISANVPPNSPLNGWGRAPNLRTSVPCCARSIRSAGPAWTARCNTKQRMDRIMWISLPATRSCGSSAYC